MSPCLLSNLPGCCTLWPKTHSGRKSGTIRVKQVPYENRGSDDGVQNFQTLFHDQEERHGTAIPPKSMMRVERSEVPFGTMKFESKVPWAWPLRVMGQSYFGSAWHEEVFGGFGHFKVHQFSPIRNLQRNLINLAFLLLRWSISTHTFVVARVELCPFVGGRGNVDWIATFCNIHVVEFLDKEGRNWVEELQVSMSKSKYSTNKAIYLSSVKYFWVGVGKNRLVNWKRF